jgi:dolichol-phosphate mannosyltransferase
MVSWIGMRQEPLLYDRDPRYAGNTKYHLSIMWKLAVDGVTAFSTKPLQWAGFFGASLILMAFGLFMVGAACWFAGARGGGWLGLLSLVTFLSGTQLVSLGILGEYVGRISEQSRARPMFLIERLECSAKSAGPMRFPVPPAADWREALPPTEKSTVAA